MIADFLSWALVMAIPGPDIVAVGAQTTRHGQKYGFFTALGATLGVALWSVVSILGIETLLFSLPALSLLLPIVGSLVLVLLGAISLHNARQDTKPSNKGRKSKSANFNGDYRDRTIVSSLRLGFITNISNPKALVFFTSFFTPMMGRYSDPAQKYLVLGILLVITLLIFSTASVLLRMAANSRLGRISALRFSPGIIFITIGVFYFFDTILAS